MSFPESSKMPITLNSIIGSINSLRRLNSLQNKNNQMPYIEIGPHDRNQIGKE